MVVIGTNINRENESQTTSNGATVTPSLDGKVLLLVGERGGGFRVIEVRVEELENKELDLEFTYHQPAPELYKPGDRISTLYGLL